MTCACASSHCGGGRHAAWLPCWLGGWHICHLLLKKNEMSLFHIFPSCVHSSRSFTNFQGGSGGKKRRRKRRRSSGSENGIGKSEIRFAPGGDSVNFFHTRKSSGFRESRGRRKTLENRLSFLHNRVTWEEPFADPLAAQSDQSSAQSQF